MKKKINLYKKSKNSKLSIWYLILSYKNLIFDWINIRLYVKKWYLKFSGVYHV